MKREKRFPSGMIVSLFFAILLLGACAVIQELAQTAKVKRPNVEIIGANLTGVSFENADFMFDINIQDNTTISFYC